MGWIFVICCIPAVPLLFIEFGVPAIRRALAKKPPASQASPDGPYRESPIPVQGPQEPAPPTYAADWKRYRRVRAITLVLWVGFVAILPFLAAAVQQVTGIRMALPVIMFGWMGSFALYGGRWQYFLCPRCKDTFRSKWRSTTFARECHSCGLPIFALTPDAHAEPAPPRFDPK